MIIQDVLSDLNSKIKFTPMKNVETVLLVIVALAFVLKFFHIPGSSILTILSLSGISVMYMYLSFALFNGVGFRGIFNKGSFQGKSAGRIVGAIGTGLALSVSAVGIVFKLQSWPGASLQLMISIVGLGAVLIVSLFKIRKNTDGYYVNLLKRVLLFGAISLALLSIPAKAWLDWRYPNNPEFVNAVLEAREHPENQKLWEKVDDERQKMEQQRYR